MTLPTLTVEQSVVLTALSDLARARETPCTPERLAEQTRWPGCRQYGVDRVRRVLGELRRLGLAQRVGRSGWEATP